MTLTDTQTQILAAAAAHPHGLALPPARLPAGARQKVAQALLKQDLVVTVHRPINDAQALWPVNGTAVLLKIVDAGLRAVGVEPEKDEQPDADQAELGGLEWVEFDAEQEVAQRALGTGVDLGAPDALERAQAAGVVAAAAEADMPAGGPTESAEGGQPRVGSRLAESPPKPLTAPPESRTGLSATQPRRALLAAAQAVILAWEDAAGQRAGLAEAVSALRGALAGKPERPVTILIDSEELESGEALSENFRKLAGPEIDAFKRELRVRGRHPSGEGSAMAFRFPFRGREYTPSGTRGWSTTVEGIARAAACGRVEVVGDNLRLVRFFDDFPVQPMTTVWDDTHTGSFTDPKVYVVQTGSKVVQRCMLMTTDPGDLVLDPTCGSGTTGFVAEQFLHDRPYTKKNAVRVTGPFTVESLSPHRVLPADEEDQAVMEALAQEAGEPVPERRPLRTRPDSGDDFVTAVLDNLQKAGLQNTKKDERLTFATLRPWPGGSRVSAEGEYEEAGVKKRAAIVIGPEYGTVGPDLVREAARECRDWADSMVVCGFAFDPQVGDSTMNLGRLVVLKARMSQELRAAEAYKAGGGNLFVVFGEPDIALDQADGECVVRLKGVDIFDPTTGEVRSSGRVEDDVACWFVDTDYDGDSFFVRHAY